MPDLLHLRQLLGDETLVARFLELFRRQMPIQMAELHSHIAAHDWDQAGATAHAIKGQLRYLNEEEAAGLAYQLETLAERGGGEEAENLARALEVAVGAVLAELPPAYKPPG